MIGAILAGVSTVASLFGSLKSAQANENTDRQLQQRKSELQNWYDKEYNTNYFDTVGGRSTMQLLRTRNKAAMQKVAQGNVIGGASDEKAVATADAIQKNDADVIVRAGQTDQYRKDNLTSQYLGQKSNLDNLDAANLQQKGQNWANFSGNALSAGIGFAQAGGEGAFDKWDGKVNTLRKNAIAKKAGGVIKPAAIKNLSMPTFNK